MSILISTSPLEFEWPSTSYHGPCCLSVAVRSSGATYWRNRACHHIHLGVWLFAHWGGGGSLFWSDEYIDTINTKLGSRATPNLWVVHSCPQFLLYDHTHKLQPQRLHDLGCVHDECLILELLCPQKYNVIVQILLLISSHHLDLCQLLRHDQSTDRGCYTYFNSLLSSYVDWDCATHSFINWYSCDLMICIWVYFC